MIHLWVDGEGWREFELTDTAELEKRNITIGDGASIGYRAFIGDEAFIGNRASIGDGVKPIIVYIIGSRFSVSYWGEDRVDIGCQSRSIEGWLTDYADIAGKNHFTTEEIEEYRGYVEFIKTVHSRNAEKEAGQ
ncbi:MAG: hypothetical protein LBT87_00940 [Treponema sp.]|jgi:NDP-sugar pyrophosphorylase family protein|nr:hypothetical protein [Treponema sp.]